MIKYGIIILIVYKKIGDFKMSFGTGASIVLGDASNLASIYEDMKQQFPPCELLTYDTILELMKKDRYKLLMYRRLAGAIIWQFGRNSSA